MTRSNFLPGNYQLGLFPVKEQFGDIPLEGNNDFEGEKIIEDDFADFDATETSMPAICDMISDLRTGST